MLFSCNLKFVEYTNSCHTKRILEARRLEVINMAENSNPGEICGLVDRLPFIGNRETGRSDARF